MTAIAPHPEAAPSLPDAPRTSGIIVALLLVLAGLVILAGLPALNAPCLQGDESLFICGNPDVNPSDPAARTFDGLLERIVRLATTVHGDLYQPIPLISYALGWQITGGSFATLRGFDVLLQALNGVLVWALLFHLLVAVPGVDRRIALPVAWLLAAIWALHPALVSTWAADMGRTHLFSHTFSLCAILAYWRHLRTRTPGSFIFVLLALVAAMLSKPILGWFVIAFMLEAWQRSLVAAVRSWRVWLIVALCVAFAWLTWYTSRSAGMIDESDASLFGDPVARSLYAVTLYARNLIAPFWVSPWYPPDPHTGWTHYAVWIGAAIVLATLGHAIRSWRHPANRAVAVGWLWCWAGLLPVIGLVGFRASAATDRYLGGPFIGILLVVGAIVGRWLSHASAGQLRRRGTAVLTAGVAVSAVLAVVDLPLATMLRSSVQRAQRVAALAPHDPRALEWLIHAYEFAIDHPLPVIDTERVPAGTSQAAWYYGQLHTALEAAAAVPDPGRWFVAADRTAAFHRRLALAFLRCNDPQSSLAQAEAARELDPDDFSTWKRLAHAQQALHNYPAAAEAYARCGQFLPDDPQTRAIHYTDFGLLLLNDLHQPQAAGRELEAAVATGAAPLAAKIALATYEVRYGEGERGYVLISQVLNVDPSNVTAGLVLAEYHLRSHHLDQALLVYAAILNDNPTLYEALRGYHETCLQLDRPAAAVAAWRAALAAHPGVREFASYFVWSLALAGAPEAPATAEQLLQQDPDNRFACLALALLAARQDDPDAAFTWTQRATHGTVIPEAQAFRRAASTLRLLEQRAVVPPGADLLRAAVRCLDPDQTPTEFSTARTDFSQLLSAAPTGPWKLAAQQLFDVLSDGLTSFPTSRGAE